MPVAKDPGSTFSFRHFRGRSFPFPFHYHPDMKLTYIARGHGQRVVGEVVRPFCAGDLVLLSSMLPHVWISDPESEIVEAYILRFDCALMESSLLRLTECAGILRWLRRAERGLEWTGEQPSGVDAGFLKVLQTGSPGRRLVRFLDLILSLSEDNQGNEICGSFQPIVSPRDRSDVSGDPPTTAT